MIGSRGLQLSAPPTSAAFRPYPLIVCGLTKHGHRFIASLATVKEPSAAIGILRKFVASSSKHVALTTLSHLLSPSTSHPRPSSIAFAVSVSVSIDELADSLNKDEANLVLELLKSSVLDQVMEWTSSELKLDLHGMHLSAAYLILLQWFDELKLRLVAENHTTPTEILVVCGCGKHSSTRGESPVKSLAKEIIKGMKCPLRIDRKNVGCFIAKGKTFKDWLCQR